MSKEPKRALVLSGGGGRGAYHVGVCRFLEEQNWTPDIIIGTSIGAVNGAAMASGHTADTLWELWKDLRGSQIQRFAWRDLLRLNWDHILDTSPLRRTLVEEGWVDMQRINAHPPDKQLRVTVVETDTGRLRVFGNSSDESDAGKCQLTTITLDHIVASCSIPVVYPATQIGDTCFWDGGTVANTPLGPAIDAGAEEIVVVLMTPWEHTTNRPRYSAVAFNGIGPRRLLRAAEAAFEWAIIASFQADLRLFNRTNEVLQMRHQHDGDSSPHRVVQPPLIISPEEPIPVADIVRYDPKNHVVLHDMGYRDAETAWNIIRPVAAS